MHTNGYQRLSWSGILTATAGLLAQQGHAANWCPTSIDYQITCNNCSRELTCDVNGIDIEIVGSNVTLDGQGYTSNNAPYNGVRVYDSQSTVKNMNIFDAAEYGVQFYGGGYLQNTLVSGSFFSGIDHPGWDPLQISGTWTYYNGYGVTGSYASSTAYTDFLNSGSLGNSFDGYLSGSSNGSWVRNSSFWDNGVNGVNIWYTENAWVDSSSFSSSTGTGLYVYGGSNNGITNNYGSGNSNYDCVVFSDQSYAYGNTWASYDGAGCLY